ncbi:MAG: 2-octaprenyl-6-methoxyphenyl hydroxylase [Gammaproteobacteria bacterium]|nr:2-octaprenyl-6-methoxyphenyl hydroxylase [Gammaproteobacteria bacterium]
MKSVQICIAGGGLVGLVAALAFSRQGHSVCVLEARDPALEQPAQMDARSIALSLSTIQIFNALGVWPQLQQQTAAIRHVHVSSAGHFGVSRLHASDLQREAMGFVVEYHVLLRYLLEAVSRDSAIELITPARLLDLQQTEHKVTLHYQRENKTVRLETSLLVVADGAHSSIREMLGIAAHTDDYHQSAIVANVKTTHAFNGYAYERFTVNGPLALLPLPDQRYALVWTNPPQRSELLMRLSDQPFIDELHRQFGYRLGYFSAVGKRVQFGLTRTRSERLADGRCVLIGNAANTLHPVAGQGFNLALRDVGQLYDAIEALDLASSGLSVGLTEYESARKKDQQRTVQLGDALVSLFSNDLPLINHLRAGALVALDVCPLLKQEFSWQGMGFGAGYSSLMRGVPR